jgi:hypothetical protein
MIHPDYYEDDAIDTDYEKWKEEGKQLQFEFTPPQEEEPDECFIQRMKEEEEYNRHLEYEAEKAEFQRIYDFTKTYPI